MRPVPSRAVQEAANSMCEHFPSYLSNCRWLRTDPGGSVYTPGMGKRYKPGFLASSFVWLLTEIYQHSLPELEKKQESENGPRRASRQSRKDVNGQADPMVSPGLKMWPRAESHVTGVWTQEQRSPHLT